MDWVCGKLGFDWENVLPFRRWKNDGRVYDSRETGIKYDCRGKECGKYRIFAIMDIAALVSGGVDSSVAVVRLKEMGFDPTIFYIKIGMEDKDGYVDCPSEEDIEITTYIAKKYG